MTPDSLAGHIVELIQLTDSHLTHSTPEHSSTAGSPADRTVSTFFKKRSYLGAKDRRVISEYFYGIVRFRRYCEALLERYVQEFPAHARLYETTGRYLALFAVYHFTTYSGGTRNLQVAKPDAPPGSRNLQVAKPDALPGSRNLQVAKPDALPGSRNLQVAKPDAQPGSRNLQVAPPGSRGLQAAHQAEWEFPEAKWRETFPDTPIEEFSSWLIINRDLEFLADQPLILRGVRQSFQDWMVYDWTLQFGEDVEKLLAALNESAPTTLRVNTLKSTRDQCREQLGTEGIECAPSTMLPDSLIAAKRFNVEGTRAFKEGAFEVQDEGSQLIAIIAGPAPGMTVIDACAGAGGKALHMSALMRNEGEIVAIDTVKRRLGELERRAVRAGASNIKTLALDDFQPENLRAKADIVLIDAPCSGSGTIRRNPWFKWTITEELVDHYNGIQKKILFFNSQFVRPGGKLVYATCSLFRKENEDVVGAFLAAHPGFSNVTADLGLPGITITPSGGFIRLAPHILPTDGFTVCVLKLA